MDVHLQLGFGKLLAENIFIKKSTELFIWLKDPEMSQVSLFSSLKELPTQETFFNENKNNTQLLPGPVPNISKQNYPV